MVQVKNAVNYSFRQKFKPSIKNGVRWNIDRERTATTREQVFYKMAFQKRDVRAEVNGDRGPGISERKLGESNVMFLIKSEGRMVDGGEETFQSGFNFCGVGNFFKLRWGVLADRMYVKAPTGKSKEELDALLFDRAARRNRTDPYEEKKYRGSGIKEVQAWWKKCQDWMAHFKEQSEPFVFDFKKLLMALSDKEADSAVGS